MNNIFERTALLIGQDKVDMLSKKHVAVFGLGGVGSYAVESLIRCNVGELTLIDSDVYSLSNINRQLYATTKTVNQKKVDVAKNRALEINPSIKVNVYDLFLNSQTIDLIDFSKFDYVIDAIDTVSSKILLISRCKELNIPIISCLGTGNKLNPFAFEIDYIENTSVCPLAKVMRKELKNRNIEKVLVLYSKEQPKNAVVLEENSSRHSPASISFVPSVAGILISSKIINDLINL